MASKGKVNMGEYLATPEELEAYRWCVNNNIYIAPKALTDARWSIVITNNNKTNEDPNSYLKNDIWVKIYEYYKYYYNKYEK
ncbi:MAG: hypothetical protein H8E16_15785 [Flavobacteriales bacterium]|nr:hypothetical protein [Flavobacteriales bacterium]